MIDNIVIYGTCLDYGDNINNYACKSFVNQCPEINVENVGIFALQSANNYKNIGAAECRHGDEEQETMRWDMQHQYPIAISST